MKAEPSSAAPPPPSPRRVIGILLSLALIRIELHLLGLHRLYTRLTCRTRALQEASEPDSGSNPGSGTEPEHARAAAAEIRRITDGYAPRRVNCLVEAIAVTRSLHRRGLAAELKLGVRTITGRLQSHAWVEYAGEPLTDEAGINRMYTPFEPPGTQRPEPSGDRL